MTEEAIAAAPSQVSDFALFPSGLQGDKEALEVLFTRHRRLLCSLAMRMLRNREEAEDAVQNCLLSAFRNLPRFKYQGSFRGWLVRIVMNEAIELLRKKKRKPIASAVEFLSKGCEEWPDCLPAPGPNPEQVFAAAESVEALRDQLFRLSTPLRSTIVLCDLKERTIEEAAAILRVPANTVKVRLLPGRRRLRLAMEGRGPSSFAWPGSPPLQLLFERFGSAKSSFALRRNSR